MIDIETHLRLNPNYPVEEFCVMFRDYLRRWVVSQSDKSGIAVDAIDAKKLYAKHVNLGEDVIDALWSGDLVSIPAQVMKDMRIKVVKAKVLVPKESSIILRDV